MRFRPGFTLIFAALLLAGCAIPTTGHKLTWRTLSRGLTSGLTTPRQEVLREESEYLKLWAEHAADIARTALPPAVDFPREMVVVVALGNRPTGGYLVEVVDAEVRGRTLRLLVGERAPQPGTLQIQQVTQPYQIIALPSVAARTQFRTVQEAGRARVTRDARPGESGQSSRRSPSRQEPASSPRGTAP